jgi:hypothetical protein
MVVDVHHRVDEYSRDETDGYHTQNRNNCCNHGASFISLEVMLPLQQRRAAFN